MKTSWTPSWGYSCVFFYSVQLRRPVFLVSFKQTEAANEAVGVRGTVVDGCGEVTVKTNDVVRRG